MKNKNEVESKIRSVFREFSKQICDDRLRELVDSPHWHALALDWERFFGGRFCMKLETLRAVLKGQNLSEVARVHGVSRQAVTRQAKRARQIFC